VYLWPSISGSTVSRVFMKFDTDAGYKELSSKHDFHEYRLNERLTLGIHEFLLHFPHLLSDLVEIRTRKTWTQTLLHLREWLKLAKGRPWFPFGRQNKLHAFAYLATKASNALVKSVYYVTPYICHPLY